MVIPVNCTDFNLWRDFVEKTHRYLFVVNPSDADAIAKAIKYIQDLPEEAYQIGKKGQKAVLEKYYWDSQEAL